MKILKLFWQLLFISTLCAEDKISIPYSDIDRGLPTLAGGCVNVISGGYVECSQDLAVAGPTPLTLDRFFTVDSSATDLYYEWVHNHHSYIYYYPYHSLLNPKNNGVYVDRSRGSFEFEGDTVESPYTFSNKNYTQGYTNCMSGQISARTNPKKIVIGRSQSHKINHPSLHTLNYVYADGLYLLSEDIFPHKKFKLRYSYDSQGHVSGVYLKNDKETFSSIEINRAVRESKNGERYISASSSDGRNVTYFLEHFKKRSGLEKVQYRIPYLHIVRVSSSHAPTIKYDYVSKSGSNDPRLISRRSLPEGRERRISYYGKDDYKVDDDQINTEKNPWRRSSDKVKTIWEPVKDGKKLTPTYKFIYYYENDEDIFKNFTFVKDAHNHLTQYCIDSKERLKSILYYKGTYKSVVVKKKDIDYAERFIWSSEGDLLGQRIDYKGKKTEAAKVYKYDKEGNIVQELQFANFSGHSPAIELEKKGLPQEGKSECYCRHYKYQSGLPTEEREDNGRITEYKYYPNSDLISEKVINDTLFHNFEYDDNACLTKSVISDRSTETRITYYYPRQKAPFGLPEKIEEMYHDSQTGQESLLKRIERKYSRQGHLTQELHYDSKGTHRYTLEWEYDAHGNVVREKNALNQWTVKKYDQNDNLIYQHGPRQDYVKHFTYDRMNRLISEEIQWGEVCYKTTHEYNELNHRIATTDYKGNRIEYKYDERGRVIETLDPQLNLKVCQEFDIFGNVTALTDPKGNTIKKTYNAYGKPVKINYPDGTVESFEYNLDGTLKSKIAKNGLETQYNYDLFGRLLEESDPFSSKTFAYNAFHKTSETDAMGVTTHFSYDGAGRLIQEETEGVKVTFEYDNLGRLHKTKDAYTLTTKEYDNLDKVIEERVEDLEGNLCKRSQFVYDADGNRIQEIHGDSCIITEYDPLGNPLKIIDPLGNVTHYTYTFGPTCITETDPLGNQTVTTYNSMEKPTEISRRNKSGELIAHKQLVYDKCGNLIRTVESAISQGAVDRTIVTEWSYNTANQLLTLIEGGVKTTTYSYNPFGQLEKVIKSDGTTIWHEYDAKGRLSRYYSTDFCYEYTYNLNDLPIKVSDTERAYNSFGQLISEKLENGYTLNYKYDEARRLTQVTLPDQKEVNYSYKGPFLKRVDYGNLSHHYEEYDLSGRLLKTKLPGQAGTLSYEYDLCSRITSILHPHLTQHLTYNSVGNLTSIDLTNPTGDYINRFQYDDHYQLSSENDTHYSHDSLNNRLKKDNTEYKVNSLNQIIQQGETTYQYDPNGNLIQAISPTETIEYTYDTLDRLIAVNRGEKEFRYTYDAFNRRLTKESENGKVDFIYQMNQEIGSPQQEELRILGKGKGADIGATIAILQNNTITIPLHNHNGSIAALIDPQTGQCEETLTYTAFGEEKTQSPLPWRFMSKRLDSETGFIYYGMRYYIPSLGRWLNPDPAGFSDGPNLYAFVRNNPFRNIDLYGLATQCCMSEPSILALPPELLSGQLSYSDFLEKHDFSKPCIFSLGRPDFVTGSMITYSNGIQTDFPSMVNNMLQISDIFDGHNVYAAYSPSGGFYSDLKLSAKEYLFESKTPSVESTQQLWSSYLNFRPLQSQIFHVGHSRGSLITHNAIASFSRLNEIHDRMTIVTLGFAKYIDQKYARSVSNYRSSEDPVTLLGLLSHPECNSLFEYGYDDLLFTLKRSNLSGITTLPCHPDENQCFDHSINSLTYRDAIVREKVNFFKEESRIRGY